jgi:hypothetical protein
MSKSLTKAGWKMRAKLAVPRVASCAGKNLQSDGAVAVFLDRQQPRPHFPDLGDIVIAGSDGGASLAVLVEIHMLEPFRGAELLQVEDEFLGALRGSFENL